MIVPYPGWVYRRLIREGRSDSKRRVLMSVETFTVTGMTCGHCVASVTSEVSKLDGVTKVDVDLASGSVTVESDSPVDPGAFALAVDEAGFAVAK
jgi:copper ion binding protein